MNTPQDKIAEMAKRFTDELISVAREELVQMLGGQSGAATSRREGSSTGKGRATSRSKGTKRAPEHLEALQTKVLNFVKKSPGLRIEQINKELGTRTKELQLPIKKLLAAKAIRANGKRRSTKYFAASGKKK